MPEQPGDYSFTPHRWNHDTWRCKRCDVAYTDYASRGQPTCQEILDEKKSAQSAPPTNG